MFKSKQVKKLVLFAMLCASSAYATVLSTSPYVYGKLGTERGDIIRDMPGSRTAYRLKCEQGQCTKQVVGYIYRRNQTLEATVQLYLPEAEELESEALLAAAQAASTGVSADGLTTAAGLAAGASELNPVLGASPNPIALIAMGLLRQRMIDTTVNDKRLSTQQKADALCTNTGLSSGAAANNLAVMAAGGGIVPVIIGMVVGHSQYQACMERVQEAQAWIESLENQGLRAYAESLAVPAVCTIQTAKAQLQDSNEPVSM